MLEHEILARNAEEALAEAAKEIDLPVEKLTISEEFEPDEQDLLDFQTQHNLPAPPKAEEITLYVVQVKFEHYLAEAEEWAQGLIERFAPGSKASAIPFKNIIIVRLEVPDASILIGKQGATLDALQHVVVRALLTIDEDFPDVMLDVERYREKKLVRLEREARAAVDKAVRSGRRVPLSPMSPAERKFIHNTFKDIPGIKTESRGQDDLRHIVIEPLNAAPQGNQNPNSQPRPQGGNGNRGGTNRGPNNNTNQGHRGGGKPPQQAGKKQPGPGVTDEQRKLLYGGIEESEIKESFQDTALEDHNSLLPEYQESTDAFDDENNGGRKLADEIE